MLGRAGFREIDQWIDAPDAFALTLVAAVWTRARGSRLLRVQRRRIRPTRMMGP